MFFKAVLAALAVLPSAFAVPGQLTRITENFGPNPNGVQFWIYVPINVQERPPILVNPHWCGGSASAVFSGASYAAENYGYIVIYPEVPREVKCWDLSSPETLKHDAGGDSLGIASMVRWAIQKYGANPNRVFSLGTSSGAMMTNVLLGAYPELFAAGSAWAGVPFGCYADVGGTAQWSDNCAKGRTIKTGAEWKAIVEAAYPGYTGWRPKMQSAHGTLDETVNIQNLDEQTKQWTAVLGQSTTPLQTLNNTPNPNWITSIYGDKYQAIRANGVSHNIQMNYDIVLDFFDLRCKTVNGCFGRPSSGVSSTTASQTRTSTTLVTSRISTTTTQASITTTTRITTTTTSPAGPTRTTTASGGPTQSKWGQCGGIGYTGPTVCVAGSTCTYSNDWYSQCL